MNCDVQFTAEEMNSFDSARVGSYFIIPLRAAVDKISGFTLQHYTNLLLQKKWKPYVWQYDDLYYHVNELFKCSSGKSSNITENASIGINFSLPVADSLKYFGLDDEEGISEDQEFYVYQKNDKNDNGNKADLRFRFRCAQIAIMHTGIGFLIVGIDAPTPKPYVLLLHAGHNDNRNILGLVGEENKTVNFCDFLINLLKDIEMVDYSRCMETGKENEILRDTTNYSIAVIPKYAIGATTDEIEKKIRRLCRNIRQGKDLSSVNYADTDENSHSIFAAINDLSLNEKAIRWGIYTLFNATTQVMFCDETSTIDPINIDGENLEDNYLPFILIALYERYSYLFFTELLRHQDLHAKKVLKLLEEQMLRLKAFGILLPADMSPYDNVNQFFKAQREIYDIQGTLKLIDDKISMISHIQSEKKEQRKSHTAQFIAAFGITSILCDSLGLLGCLLQDSISTLLYRIAFFSEIFIMGGIFLVLRIINKRR